MEAPSDSEKSTLQILQQLEQRDLEEETAALEQEMEAEIGDGDSANAEPEEEEEEEEDEEDDIDEAHAAEVAAIENESSDAEALATAGQSQVLNAQGWAHLRDTGVHEGFRGSQSPGEGFEGNIWTDGQMEGRIERAEAPTERTEGRTERAEAPTERA